MQTSVDAIHPRQARSSQLEGFGEILVELNKADIYSEPFMSLRASKIIGAGL